MLRLGFPVSRVELLPKEAIFKKGRGLLYLVLNAGARSVGAAVPLVAYSRHCTAQDSAPPLPFVVSLSERTILRKATGSMIVRVGNSA